MPLLAFAAARCHTLPALIFIAAAAAAAAFSDTLPPHTPLARPMLSLRYADDAAADATRCATARCCYYYLRFTLLPIFSAIVCRAFRPDTPPCRFRLEKRKRKKIFRFFFFFC
jgi:hypothetical protein